MRLTCAGTFGWLPAVKTRGCGTGFHAVINLNLFLIPNLSDRLHLPLPVYSTYCDTAMEFPGCLNDESIGPAVEGCRAISTSRSSPEDLFYAYPDKYFHCNMHSPRCISCSPTRHCRWRQIDAGYKTGIHVLNRRRTLS